ncbi:MAG: hypothetical protein E7324_02780 [Clostridiales bacterium]|nr:hypothetical protein [Clostridiales bacterium]
MMKRLLALCLALMLILPHALGENDNPDLPERFRRQATVSGMMGTITFRLDGAQTAAIDPMVWALLQSLAPRLTLDLKNSYLQDRADRDKGDGQGSITLLLDGQSLGAVTSRYNQDMVAVSSDLLSASPVFYAAVRGWDIATLFQSQNAAWPSLWQAIRRTENASPEWHARVSARLIPYETKVGIWLNGYSQFSTGNENGVPYTQLWCRIPAQAVKAQLKQLLVDFYGDEELLACLREVFDAREAAAYLQPDMMQFLFTLIDMVELEGEVEIQRRYDLTGNSLIDSITLPLPGDYPMTHLTIAHTPHEAGVCWIFSCQTAQGLKAEVSCVIGEENLYSGSVLLEIPKETEDTYVVDEAWSPVETIAFDYNFSWEPGTDIYTLLSSHYDRTCKATLLIRPREDMEMPAQSLILDAAFGGGSDPRDPTTLTATLSWRDLDSDATITAAFSGRTATARAIVYLEDTENLLRLDQADAQVISALQAQWAQQLENWLTQAMIRMFPVYSVQPAQDDGI